MSFEKQAIIAKKRELVQRYEKEILAGPNGSNCETKLVDFRKLLNEMEQSFWKTQKAQDVGVYGRNESSEVDDTVWKQTSKDTEPRGIKRRFSCVDHTPGKQAAELKSSLSSPNENKTNATDEGANLERQRRPSVTAVSPNGLKIRIRLISVD